MNIHEVMKYGYIVASNEDLDILITVNGPYYNIWCGDYSGNYTNTDCYATFVSTCCLYGQDIVKVTDKAQSIIDELLKGAEEDE